MNEAILLITALLILYINRSIPERYMRYEDGVLIRPRARQGIRMQLLRLSARFGERVTRGLALLSVTLIWVAFMAFCAAAAGIYPQPLLKVIAILVGGLGTVAYVRDLSIVWSNFIAWCYSQEDDILLITRGCWEVVLAGLVLVDSLLLI